MFIFPYLFKAHPKFAKQIALIYFSDFNWPTFFNLIEFWSKLFSRSDTDENNCLVHRTGSLNAKLSN